MNKAAIVTNDYNSILTARISAQRFLYKEAKIESLLESPRKQEALEEIIYYIVANLLLTINVAHTVRCPLFILSKNLMAILLLESPDKWDMFWKCLDDFRYPEELQEKAHSMILEWYTVLSR